MTTFARPMVSQDEPVREVQSLLDREFEKRPPRDVLDVGCGFTLPVDIPRTARLVGLDVDAEALAKNENIDEGLVGDIDTYPLPEESYDAVLCWTVLEHLTRPQTAVSKMARALRPGGLLIIGVPNVWSLKALVTKLTPHRFHVWVYRKLLRYPNAGRPGFGPYPTYLRREVSPAGLLRLAEGLDLERIYADTYSLRSGLPARLDALWSVATKLGRIVTLGAWDAAASEHVAVFRKRERVGAQPELPRDSSIARS